ncbi:hypothetical protein ACH5RR_005740 [Cinchona calisaya]|uniref:t-SNARE coiled-coil homology domain-containing protein n=1 Tax=Cinchona calisaya TaxID=153742 RepID=A0ABD3AMB6_9GENT
MVARHRLQSTGFEPGSLAFCPHKEYASYQLSCTAVGAGQPWSWYNNTLSSGSHKGDVTAVLVDAQGDMIDNIEIRVSTAVDHVQSGNTALQKAKKLQRNSRKWMCIAILILLIIVAIIVVGVLKPWKSNNGA